LVAKSKDLDVAHLKRAWDALPIDIRLRFSRWTEPGAPRKDNPISFPPVCQHCYHHSDICCAKLGPYCHRCGKKDELQ
jgi:hypothetical protein